MSSYQQFTGLQSDQFAVWDYAFDHVLFDGEPFSTMQAWLWLIANAARTDYVRKNVNDGTILTLKRGQYACPEDTIGVLRCAWNKKRRDVRSILNNLKAVGLINWEYGKDDIIITVCDFDKFWPQDVVP